MELAIAIAISVAAIFAVGMLAGRASRAALIQGLQKNVRSLTHQCANQRSEISQRFSTYTIEVRETQRENWLWILRAHTGEVVANQPIDERRTTAALAHSDAVALFGSTAGYVEVPLEK